MKQFKTPELRIIRFEVEDVITSSELRDDEFGIVSVGKDEMPLVFLD